jgi:hypothetical protein
MIVSKHKLTASIAVVLGMAAVVFFGRVTAEEKSSADLSKAEFAKLLKQLHVKNLPWASIPWKISLTEARQLAAKEKKPVFLVVNTGNCLGWT